jgi:hypothetical protein
MQGQQLSVPSRSSCYVRAGSAIFLKGDPYRVRFRRQWIRSAFWHLAGPGIIRQRLRAAMSVKMGHGQTGSGDGTGQDCVLEVRVPSVEAHE